MADYTTTEEGREKRELFLKIRMLTPEDTTGLYETPLEKTEISSSGRNYLNTKIGPE